MKAMMRRRTTFASLAAAGLVVSSLATAASLTGTGAMAAPPAGDCAVPFPISELEDGDAVTGLTVEKGVTPTGFTGEVLGVVHDGIAPGIDLVMVDLTSPGIDRVGSIWEGMSGSPVYATDGRLIGAVSYSLASGASQIAGVTPFEAMDDYADVSAAASIKVDRASARMVARHTDVSVAKAQKGFRQLRPGLSVSGVDTQRAARVLGRGYLGAPLAGATSTARAAGTAADIVAGGNLGASAVYGDLTAGGVGTVTSVCNGRVFGFGHPMGYLGETTLSMHPASVVLVQPSPADSAFKVANLGAPVGTVDRDAMAGLTGSLGALPQGTEVRSTSTYGNRKHSGASVVTVPELLADASYMQLAASVDRAVDATMRGTAEVAWKLEGSKDGAPVRLELTDRFLAEEDVAYEAGWELLDLAYAAVDIPGLKIDRITSDASVVKDSSFYRVRRVRQLVDGKWAKVKGRVQVKAGSTLNLRVGLVGKRGTVLRKVSIKIPKRLKGERTEIQLTGGAEHYSDASEINTWTSLKKYVAGNIRNDEVVAQLPFVKEQRMVIRTKKTRPAPLLVGGEKVVKIRVK